MTSVLAGCALAATIGLVPGSPAQAEPNIEAVQSRVDTLYHEAEQASERYNDARIELEELRQEVEALRADENREDSSLEVVREQARDAILRQYAGTTLSTVGEVLAAGDPGEFLEQVSTMSSYQRLQQGLFDSYRTGLKALDIRRDATVKQLDQVAEAEARLAEEKATIDEKVEAAEALLDRLEEEERLAVLSRDAARTTTDLAATEELVTASAPASGRGGAAVAYAMAQVGDSYVYGAAGPSSFDCSGLTMMAWAAAGVALPHSSSAQYSSGTRVAASDLQPGDLVFYYSPISHVGMYIGNGNIVHAANPSTGVNITGLYSMPYVGAVRPG
jgi:cell wall-associated NlpC family hydrolase